MTQVIDGRCFILKAYPVCIFSSMQLCDLLKSRVECPDFLAKLESAQFSVSQNISGMEPMLSSYLNELEYNIWTCFLMLCTYMSFYLFEACWIT